MISFFTTYKWRNLRYRTYLKARHTGRYHSTSVKHTSLKLICLFNTLIKKKINVFQDEKFLFCSKIVEISQKMSCKMLQNYHYFFTNFSINNYYQVSGQWNCAFVANNTGKYIWVALWQNQQNQCAPSEDSDQPGHPPSLIRIFAVRSMGS